MAEIQQLLFWWNSLTLIRRHCTNTNLTKQLEKETVDWNNTCNDESLKKDRIHIQSQLKNLSHTIKELEIDIGSKNNHMDSLNNDVTFTNFTHHQTIASKDSKIDKFETTIESLEGTKFVSVQYAIDHV